MIQEPQRELSELSVEPRAGFWSKLRTRMMGLGDKDVAPLLAYFEPAEPAAKERLTQVVQSFVAGYNLGVACENMRDLIDALGRHDHERSGFAWEGAGMGVALRTLMVPGNRAFADYLALGSRHHYIVHIGAGWAMARVGFRHGALRKQMCPIYHWLAWDGMGFHQTMFEPQKTVQEHRGRPTKDYSGPAFDQGVGRALWFVAAARPDELKLQIHSFPAERHADLWGGVGLATTYAGGVPDDILEAVVEASGEHRAALGVGSALAVHTRHRTGNATPHTARASLILTGHSEQDIPPLIHSIEAELGTGDEVYPRLRSRLQAHFQKA